MEKNLVSIKTLSNHRVSNTGKYAGHEQKRYAVIFIAPTSKNQIEVFELFEL